MTVTQAQIDVAKRNGLTNVEALAEACDRYKFPFYLAATILDKETDGQNIFGHDKGGAFSDPTGANVEVTEERFKKFKEQIKAGKTSNGVGPMQLTYKPYFLGPDSVEARGLRPWHPADNILYGVSILSGTWKSSKGSIYEVGRAYNGARAYGLATVALAKVWKNRVGTADLSTAPTPDTTPEPAPEPEEPAVKHSSKWGADYVSWKGEGWVTVQDHAILTVLDRESWDFWHGIHLTQGGLSNSEPKSAGSHLGLGAFDVRTRNNTKAEVWLLAAMFLRSGMEFFPRGYNLGGWNPFSDSKHGHVVSRESYDSLAPLAKDQYQEYDRGGDGLVGSAKYTGPKTPFERWKTSPYNPANISEDTNLYYVDVKDGFLWGLDVDRNKKSAHEKGAPLQAARQIKRWGRTNMVTPTGVFYAADYLSATQPEEKPS